MELSSIIEFIEQYLDLCISYFTNPGKRIYYWWWLSTFFLALYVFITIKAKGNFLNYFFHKDHYWSKSAFFDYFIFAFNNIIKIICILPFLYLAHHIVFWTEEQLTFFFGFSKMNWSRETVIILYTLSLTIVGDFFNYALHWAFHKVPFLWEFHKIHHSAEGMNPITQYRVHPIELILNNAKFIIISALITGLFDYWSDQHINKWTIIGVNGFHIIFLFLGANLRHTHIPLKYFPFLEYIFISPRQHQIHHSNNKDHFNTNIGSKLAIWDWLFGTLIRSKDVSDIEFGIDTNDNSEYHHPLKGLYLPFVKIWRMVFK